MPALFHMRHNLTALIALTALITPGLVHASDVEGTRVEFYSESVKADDGSSTGLLSETRARVFPFDVWRAKPFFGGYSNSFHHGPLIGASLRLHPTWTLDAIVEQRWVYNESHNGQPETRTGLIAGDWTEFDPAWISESYAEVIFIPRLHRHPVATLWTRLFYRKTLIPRLVFDPFVQLWARNSPAPDFGESGIEIRPGVRLAWTPPSAHIGIHLYQRGKLSPRESSELEGMLVLWGELK